MLSEAPDFRDSEEAAVWWEERAVALSNALDEARLELEDFQCSSRELEQELETQLDQSERRCRDLLLQIQRLTADNEALRELRDASSVNLNKLQEELTRVQAERESMARYIRDLEQINDDLERAKRLVADPMSATLGTRNFSIGCFFEVILKRYKIICCQEIFGQFWHALLKRLSIPCPM